MAGRYYEIPVDEKFRGPKGPPGEPFNVDASGLKANRPAFVAGQFPFSYLADDTGELSVKRAAEWGLWIQFRGHDGLPGAKGDPGQQGAKGDTGDRGNTGERGPTGDTGPAGTPGAKGDTGERGPTGDTGQQGDPGQQGAKGDTGDPGPEGKSAKPNAAGPIASRSGWDAQPEGFLFHSTDENPDANGNFRGYYYYRASATEGTWSSPVAPPTGPQGAQGAQGLPGEPGPRGATGLGVPTGGSTGHILRKKSGADYDTEFVAPPFTAKADLADASDLAKGSALVGHRDGTLQRKLDERISVKDFGAKGGGVTDDRAAMQAAIDYVASLGGGTVLVPKTAQGTYYRVTSPVYLRDHVRLVGEGYGSHIRNDRTATGNNTPDVSVLMCGNYNVVDDAPTLRENQNSFKNEPYKVANAAVAGQGTLTLAASDAAGFAPGDIALIHNNTLIPNHTHWNPMKAEINEVVGVLDGVLTLRHPLSDDYPVCMVAKSGGAGMMDKLGQPVKIVKRAAVENLRLTNNWKDSLTWGIFAQGGSFECDFRNLYVEGAAFFSQNGVSRATIENIRGRVSRKAFDIAYFSHHNRISNAKFSRIPGSPQAAAMCAVVEGAHDNIITDSYFDHGDASGFFTLFFGSGARRNVADDVDAVGLSVGDTKAAVYIGDGEVFTSQNRLRHVRARVGPTASYGIILYSDGAAFSEENILDAVEVHGTPSIAGIRLAASSRNNRLHDPYLPNSSVSDLGTNNRLALVGSASETASGLMDTGTQRFAGSKTFTGTLASQTLLVTFPNAAVTYGANNTIAVPRSMLRVQSSAAVTLASAPNIAAGTLDGQRITILNVGAFNITFQDRDTLAGSGIELGAGRTSYVLEPLRAIHFVWISALSAWVCED